VDRTIKAIDETKEIDPYAEAITNEVKEKLQSMPLEPSLLIKVIK